MFLYFSPREKVCDFALDVIRKHATEHVFDMETVSPGLCQSKTALKHALEARREATLVMPFIETCRTDGNVKE